MGLPYRSQHAGEIFFGPKDGFLYLTMGDGGNSTHGDPWNFSQKKNSLLGKVLRVDINSVPSKYTRRKILHLLIILLHFERNCFYSFFF
jgi:glucose/arabinose dehydrogenase